MMLKPRVIRGRFGKPRGRTSGLPPELVSLLDVGRKKRARRRYLTLWSGAVAVGLVIGIAPSLIQSSAARHSATPAGPAVAFGFCHTGGGYNCVVDGDTMWFEGQKIRIADIDAPETHDYLCASEKELGDRATQRLIQLVSSGPITLRPIERDEDVYGRKLRIVLVNGTSVGDTLVGEGLARYYGGRRRPWC